MYTCWPSVTRSENRKRLNDLKTNKSDEKISEETTFNLADFRENFLLHAFFRVQSLRDIFLIDYFLIDYNEV